METITQNIQELAITLSVIDQLRKISRSLRKSFENDCNYGECHKRTVRQQRLTSRAMGLAHNIGYNIYVQGDPRGCALYLIDNSMNDGNYNNGIALY